MYCLIVLEALSTRSSFQQTMVSLKPQGRHFRVSFSFLGIASNPWHSLACSRVPPIFAFVITQSSPHRFPSFSEELQVIGLRVSLLIIQTHHDYICKAPISKYGHIYRNQGVRGEGNDNPLPYSCLESPVDRGAWWAAVHGVVQSRT